MNLYAENILKYQELSVDFGDGITLVVGPNEAGKSCLAAILGAVTAHEPNPLHYAGAARTLYVRDGAAEGMAEMDGVQWRPGSGISAPTGQEPTASIESAGLVDFVVKAQRPASRAEVWKDLFDSASPRQLLAPVWTLGERQLEKTLEIIENRGWKNAEKIYVDQRRAAKQKWKSITGEDFGAKKAAAWKPEGWQPELEGASEADLIHALSEARGTREAATVSSAISEAEIEAARKVRDSEIPELEGRRAKVEEQRAEASSLVHQAEAERSAVNEKLTEAKSRLERARKALDAEPPLECPTCQEGLFMQRGVGLQKWRALTKEERQQAKQVIEEQTAAIKSWNAKSQTAEDDYVSAQKALTVIQRERSAIDGELKSARQRSALADRDPQDETNQGVLAALERQVETARRNLEAWRANRDAQEQVESVTQLEAVIALLGPNGPRAEGIRQGIANINAVLKRVEAISGWKPLTLSKDYQLFSGGRPIQAVAKSERIRAQWSLQIACAILKRNTWVILDEADILREETWNGLVKVIDAISKGMPALRFVICATRGVEHPIGWQVIELT